MKITTWPDPYLAEALDLLSRVEDPETGRLHFVDYGPLDVRHLGSIYEGLLEYVLRAAEKDLPAVTSRERTVRDPVRRGELYLASDRGERHTTGSFYTPDYVVQYIVEYTLGPLVEGRSAGEILELKVLDPAMGSGHFLVAATAFLARAAVRAVAEGEQRLVGDFAVPDPEHLRRLVVERCIFGVDKNPRAVELAKLALWLATVQKDKALNFLDHHLKHGDSLLGARVREMGTLPARNKKPPGAGAAEQYNAFESAFRQSLFRALGFVYQIERLPSETEADIKRKEEFFREAEAVLGHFRRAADLWASALFGNEAPVMVRGKEVDALADRYTHTVGALRDSGAWEALAGEPWFARAAELAGEHDFFHWEIEFPDIFYEENGSKREIPGFDAVIGNPPYVRMEEFKNLKDFLRAVYRTYETRADLYIYFIERSLGLLRDGGGYGVIVSNKFLRANYGAPLRALLGDGTGVREIVDFGELPVFEDAAAMPALFFCTRGTDGTEACRFAALPSLGFDDLAAEIERHAFAVDPASIRGAEWRLVPRETAMLLDKMEAAGIPLGEVVEGRICWGVKTGRNEAFFMDGSAREQLLAEDPRNAEVIKPLVVGDDVRRYRIDRRDAWLLYFPHGVDIGRYPAVERYLEPFRESLEKRATKQAWYELQQPQEAYRDFFEGPKILYPEIAKESRFAFDAGPLYPNNKCFIIPGENWFLLGVLNSRLAFFYLSQICSVLGDAAQGGRLELRAQYMERLPIPRASEPDTAELAELARRMTDLEARMQRERREFLTWLEGEIGCRVDDVSGRTRVREYDAHDAETLLEILDRNHPRRVRLDVTAPRDYGVRNENRERIERAHATSTARLAPLAEECARLDAEADRRVYRLYGLAEEEIAVVEGSG